MRTVVLNAPITPPYPALRTGASALIGKGTAPQPIRRQGTLATPPSKQLRQRGPSSDLPQLQPPAMIYRPRTDARDQTRHTTQTETACSHTRQGSLPRPRPLLHPLRFPIPDFLRVHIRRTLALPLRHLRRLDANGQTTFATVRFGLCAGAGGALDLGFSVRPVGATA